LTTLSALIGENATLAEKFVDELSKVYRYLLRAGRQPLVSLDEELRFAESYIFLLVNRFPDGMFSIENGLSQSLSYPHGLEDSDLLVPALVFQNILDHLLRSQNLPLRIKIQMGRDGLRFSCNDQPKKLSFETSNHDWKQLDSYGVLKEIRSGQLVIFIPYITNRVT
jgi:LytS/YehU family sensor histidine kinase